MDTEMRPVSCCVCVIILTGKTVEVSSYKKENENRFHDFRQVKETCGRKVKRENAIIAGKKGLLNNDG